MQVLIYLCEKIKKLSKAILSSLTNFCHFISKILSQILIFIVTGLRPILGPSGCCKFDISCGNYAVLQLKDENLLIAVFNIIKRIISCNPFL